MIRMTQPLADRDLPSGTLQALAIVERVFGKAMAEARGQAVGNWCYVTPSDNQVVYEYDPHERI